MSGAYLLGEGRLKGVGSGVTPRRLFAYKVVNADLQSPYASISQWRECPLRSFVGGPLTYEIGKLVEAPSLETDRCEICAHGVNLLTLDAVQGFVWGLVSDLRHWGCIGKARGLRVLEVEIPMDSTIVVPIDSNGKFRANRCIPVRDITDFVLTGEYAIDSIISKIDLTWR